MSKKARVYINGFEIRETKRGISIILEGANAIVTGVRSNQGRRGSDDQRYTYVVIDHQA